MSKRTVIVIFIVMMTVIIISLYATYAIDEETSKLEASSANYNLIYSLKEKSNREVLIASHEEKYVDISFRNGYQSTVRYGIYYRLINPDKLPDNITITLSENSKDPIESNINSGEGKTVTIKITNNSDYNIDLVLGALIGFENGHLEELVKNGEVLIK